jgi:hypothetical protein
MSYKRRDQGKLSTPQGKLASAIRCQIHRALKHGGITKDKRTFDLLGYSLEQLKAHLEAKFLPGMTWSNYGQWHLDHVIPKSWFTYGSADEFSFEVCWSLWNFEPRWGLDNLRKRNRCVERTDGSDIPIQSPAQLSALLQG